MKKIIAKIIDAYLNKPIVIDFVVVAFIWFFISKLSVISFVLSDRSNQIDIIPYLISANVSLAGFILAALTIIVTFKSNLQSKGISEATNALELIFSSRHYDSIVMVFKKSLLEYIICFILLFIFWLSIDNLKLSTINKLNYSALILISTSTLRSIYILFTVLALGKFKKEN